MSTLAMIDRQLPITVYATTSRMTREHVLRELAFEMVMPELLHVDEQIDEAEPLVIKEAGEFLDWLRRTPGGRQLEAGLQCMSVSADGIPLLTSWLCVRDFGRLVLESRGTRFSMRLHQALAAWGALGMDKVYFEGFKMLPAGVAVRKQGLPC
jgi:hypothetical protein